MATRKLVALIAVAAIVSSVDSALCPKDRCASNPCQNGGACTSTPGVGKGYNCVCDADHTGTYCEVPIECEPEDPCSLSPCMNGGKCAPTGVDGVGYVRYTCTCPSGFKGIDCEVADAPAPTKAPPPPTTTPRPTEPPPPTEPPAPTTPPPTTEPPIPPNPCDPSPCKNHEECTTSDTGRAKCTCPPQYTGCACDVLKVTVCPTGFTYLSEGKSCYKMLNTLADWNTHRTSCKSLYSSSDLAKVTSLSEHNGLVSFLKTYPTAAEKATCVPKGWYVGLQRKTLNDCNSPFEWKSITTCSAEAATYFNWMAGEPSCGGENCVHFRSDTGSYQWNDVACSYAACAICELPVYY